jgi:2'-hydroxyisoflavone reductase
MQLLVVGGTGFLGGAVTRAALAAGHAVTVLTRGRRPLPAGVRSVIADRSAPLPRLPPADAVIDTCAFQPSDVAHLLTAVETGRYVMISSVSAYSDLAVGPDEASPADPLPSADIAALAALEPEARARAMMADYGPLKAAAEAAAGQHLGERAVLVRLGLIVGPGDPTDRFTYWVRRMDQPGPAAAPGPPDQPVQVIDVRDAAHFILMLAQGGPGGPINVTGPALPLGTLLTLAAAAAGRAPQITWLPLQSFLDAGLSPWSDLPLILPDDGQVAGLMAVRTDRAQALGLRTRPLAETLADTLAWDRGRRDQPLRAGMTAGAEARVLRPPGEG